MNSNFTQARSNRNDKKILLQFPRQNCCEVPDGDRIGLVENPIIGRQCFFEALEALAPVFLTSDFLDSEVMITFLHLKLLAPHFFPPEFLSIGTKLQCQQGRWFEKPLWGLDLLWPTRWGAGSLDRRFLRIFWRTNECREIILKPCWVRGTKLLMWSLQYFDSGCRHSFGSGGFLTGGRRSGLLGYGWISGCPDL